MIKSKLNLIKFTAGIFFTLQIIGATVILSCPLPALAQSKSDSVNSLQFTPQVTIPNSTFNSGASTSVGTYNSATGKIDSTLLAKYIGAIYNYSLAIAGILATIMLMAAGVIWLTSGGDSGKVSQAKELISGSIAGLIILVVSWVILNTINPDLVNLKAVSTTNLVKTDISYLVCCSPTTGELKYPIKIVNGKKIATDGSLAGKEIKCSGQSTTCSGKEVCKLSTDNKYACFRDSICCNCQRWNVVVTNLSTTCKDGITYDECDKLCLTWWAKWVAGYKLDYYNNDDYDCVNDKCTFTSKYTGPTTCHEATGSSDCARLGTCYWQDNKCITKTESGATLCSATKSDIKEKYPQCCCEQVNYNYTNCKWSVSGGTTYCASSCGSNYTSVSDSYCQ